MAKLINLSDLVWDRDSLQSTIDEGEMTAQEASRISKILDETDGHIYFRFRGGTINPGMEFFEPVFDYSDPDGSMVIFMDKFFKSHFKIHYDV